MACTFWIKLYKNTVLSSVMNSADLDELVTRVPGVWRSNALARGDALDARGARVRVLASGHAALDAQLPGGGWPSGGVIELLQPRAAWESGQGVWALLGPGLAQAACLGAPGALPIHLLRATQPTRKLHKALARPPNAAPARPPNKAPKAPSAHQSGIALIGMPQQPFAPALGRIGLPVDRLIWVRREAGPSTGSAGSAHADLHDFWATEQALRCADVAAVAAWLPRLTHAQLQRLNHCASGKWLFVWRPESALRDATPARLRLWVGGDFGEAQQPHFGSVVRVLKRQGPPMVGELRLGWQGLAVPALAARPKPAAPSVNAVPPGLALAA
jgi:protein ImuA